MQVNLFWQTYFAIHGFIVIEVHQLITKYLKISTWKKGIKITDVSNICTANSSNKPIVYVKYYIVF